MTKHKREHAELNIKVQKSVDEGTRLANTYSSTNSNID